MKKLVSTVLTTLMLAGIFVSCVPADQRDHAITLVSSDAAAYAEWLDERLDVVPDDVVIGVGSNDAYGIDMTDFESDGYILRENGGQILIFGATADGLDRAVRKYVKGAEEGTTENLDEVYHEGVRIEKLTIAGRDISEYTVVYNNDRNYSLTSSVRVTNGNARYAAHELVRLLEEATGITLPTAIEETETPMIKIDYLTDGKHGENGFRYEVKDGDLYIYGVTDANGCANGVYHFLQTWCGWEDLMYGDSDLKDAELVEVPEGASADVDPIFDGFSVPWSSSVGSIFENDRVSYSQTYYGTFFKAHHSMGERMEDQRYMTDIHPCFSDESTYEVLLDSVRSEIKEMLAVEKIIGEDLVMIQLATGDNNGWCVCQNCRQIYRQEGNVHSGAVLRVVNRIAEQMESERYGGINYNMYGAYLGTWGAPAVTVPRDDVYITYCTDGHCFIHPIAGDTCYTEAVGTGYNDLRNLTNQFHEKNIRDWAEITDNLVMVYYALDYGLFSYSVIGNLYEDIQFFKEIGAKGLYFFCDYSGLGISRVEYQLIMKMQWDPDMTEEEYETALCEILDKEYGEGGFYIREYINLWEEAQNRAEQCRSCWAFGWRYISGTYDPAYYTENFDHMTELFHKALLMTSTAEQEKRLETLGASMVYEGCAAEFFGDYRAGDTKRLDVLRERYARAMECLVENGFDLEKIGSGISYYSFFDTLDKEVWKNWCWWIELYEADGYETLPEPPEEYK